MLPDMDRLWEERKEKGNLCDFFFFFFNAKSREAIPAHIPPAPVHLQRFSSGAPDILAAVIAAFALLLFTLNRWCSSFNIINTSKILVGDYRDEQTRRWISYSLLITLKAGLIIRSLYVINVVIFTPECDFL